MADGLIVKEEDCMFAVSVCRYLVAARTKADQSLWRDAQRIGKIGDLLPEAVAVGNVAFQGRIGKRIGRSAAFRVVRIPVDGLIRISEALPDDGAPAFHEQAEQERRLILLGVLHLVDEQ